MPSIKAKDFLSALLRYGCVEVSVKGSHHKVRNPANGKVSTVPVHSGRDIKKGLAAAILSQLGIDADEFLMFV